VFDLAPLGGWAAVGPVAMANLSRLPLPDHEAVATRRGATVHLLSSEDMFGASRLLILDHLLGALRIPASPFGTLVAVPHRHLLAVHVLEGANVVPALDTLVALARSGVDAAGPVSPEVYFRATDGGLQRVTSTAADGTVTVEVDGAFSQAMAAAGLVT